MTVSELIAELQKLPPGIPVMVGLDMQYGIVELAGVEEYVLECAPIALLEAAL